MSPLEAGVASVRSRVAAACERAGRDPESIRIVAATKGRPVAAIAELPGLGIGDIGENRVQEAAEKQRHLEIPFRWHLFGHLQSNKARRAAGLFDAVHSIDSRHIGEELGLGRDTERDPIAGLVQVDYTGLPGRSGLSEIDTFEVVRALAGTPGLHIIGLMTVAAPGAAAARHAFARLRGLRDALEARTGWPLPELSMGMSDDFEIAVEEGATMLRIGRALFDGTGTPQSP